MANPSPTKKIRLIVREEFHVPEIYLTGDPADIEEALWIGATIQGAVTGRRGDEGARRLAEEKERELAAIRGRYAEQEAALRTALAEAEAAAATAAQQAAKAERTAADGQLAILQSRYEALDARRKELEASREQDIQAATARCQQIMEKVVQAKEDQISRMEAAHARLQEGLTKHSEELVRLSAAVQRKTTASANVKTKGSEYESEFRDKLVRAYGLVSGFSLKETRLGAGHEMDFVMRMEDETVMWELKDYSAPVPKAEVDKFIRDLRGNEGRIGVMISRTTDITGKAAGGDFVVETDEGKLAIYIGRFESWCGEGGETQVFQTLAAIFRLWWSARRPDEEGAAAAPAIDVDGLIKELERQLVDVAKRRTEWRQHKSRLDEAARWVADLLEEAEGRLDRLLKTVRGTATAPKHTVPTGIFREADDERGRQWIQSILDVAIPTEGHTVELRELVDGLAAIHKLSKDTIRTHVKSVLLDTSITKGKGSIILVKGLIMRAATGSD